jgi:hypothetical protein
VQFSTADLPLFDVMSKIVGHEKGHSTATAGHAVASRVTERVWLPLEGHGPPEETELSRYS